MKKNKDGILIPDEDELPGLQMAYELYAAGKSSDLTVAEMLNKEGYRSKTGRRFSKETVELSAPRRMTAQSLHKSLR
jgi:hypothetical protein